ncbi:hypothetical protein C8J31_11424 [Rhizobium sp. PP-CC-2G-626]|nr:hypothetical protein C8J31_11424 [Rhizobium sp. PP-CC-2G-626]
MLACIIIWRYAAGKRALAHATAIAVMMQPANPGFAQASSIQPEAERALREIDCQILVSSADVERLGGDLQNVARRFGSNIEATSKAVEKAKDEAVDLIEEVGGSMAEVSLSMVLPENSVLPSKKVGRPSNAVKAWKASEVVRERLSLWVKNLLIAKGLANTLAASQEMKAQEARMIQVGRELDFVSQQLSVTETSVQKLLKYRDTTEDAFTAKGAKLQGRYFGEACGPSKMDGVWRTEYLKLNLAKREDIIEIRENSFRFDSGTPNVTDTCGVFEGDLSYANDGSATGVIRKECDGLNVIMGFEFRKVGDELESRVCQTFSYKPEMCEISSDSFPINMVKIHD